MTTSCGCRGLDGPSSLDPEQLEVNDAVVAVAAGARYAHRLVALGGHEGLLLPQMLELVDRYGVHFDAA